MFVKHGTAILEFYQEGNNQKEGEKKDQHQAGKYDIKTPFPLSIRIEIQDQQIAQ